MFESKFQQVVSIALALKCILEYKLIDNFSIKCYFRENLKIDVTKNRFFWGISKVMHQSIPSLTIPPTRATPWDSHILVAPGVGFSLLDLAWGCPRGLKSK